MRKLFRSWKVLNLRTGDVIEVEACNAEFALLEAAKQVYTIAESNELPFSYGQISVALGDLATTYKGWEI